MIRLVLWTKWMLSNFLPKKVAYRARFVVPSGDSRVPLRCTFSSVNLDSETKQNWRSGNQDLLSILQFRPLFYTSFGLITLVDSRYTWVPMLFMKNENITNRNYIYIYIYIIEFYLPLKILNNILTRIFLSLLQSWKSNLRSPRNSTGLLCLFFQRPTLSTSGLKVCNDIKLTLMISY